MVLIDMHALILILASVLGLGGGGWSHAGWFADPPAAAPGPPAPKPKPKPDTKCPCPCGVCPCTACACVAAPAPPVKRQLWQLIANDGTVYRMYEKDELIRLVTEHNRKLAAAPPPVQPPAAGPPVFTPFPGGFGGGGCPGGSCPR